MKQNRHNMLSSTPSKVQHGFTIRSLMLCCSLLMLACTLHAQTTYYWVGGATATWTLGSNWNTALNGSGTSRNTPATNDILIFDGTNIGGSTPSTGLASISNVPYQTVGSLIFQNGANVKFTTSPGTAGAGTTAAGTLNGTAGSYTGQTVTGTGTAFTTFFTVGDFISTGTANTGTGGTNALGQITAINNDASLTQSNGALAMIASNGTSVFYIKDVMIRVNNTFSVDATSKVDLGSSAPLIIKLNTGATGNVYGTVAFSNNFQKLVVDKNSTTPLTFHAGSRFQFTGTQSSAPFDAVPNATNDNIVFKAGSFFENASTTSTNTNACGNVFGAVLPNSVVQFQKGSTFIQNSNTLSSILSSSHRAYPNVILNGTTSGWQPTTLVDTLTIGAGTTWTNSSGSFFPIKGDFIINGTLATGTSTPVFVFCGTVPQNVKANGSFSSGGLNKIVIAAGSTLKLGSNITQSDAASLGSFTRVYGTLDFDTYVINSASTSQTSILQGFTSGTSTGSITGGVVAATSPCLITVSSNTGFAQGMLISGAGIPANTYIVGTTGSNSLFVSNPIPAGTYDLTSSVNPSGATFITSNPGGIAASYPVNGTSSYTLGGLPGNNYRFNAATTTPFPASLTTVNTNNIQLAADVSVNVPLVTVSGTLNLASNTLTIPVNDTVRILSGNPIQGSSSTKFVSLGVNTTNGTQGILRMANINTTTTLPIGCNGYYLPVTVSAAAANEDLSVSVFNGITTDGKPNGTPFTAQQKANVVDAVWNIFSHTSNTTLPTIQLGWPATLEGSSFTTFTNSQLGIAQYATTNWDVATGTGNNTSNTATRTLTAYGPLGVGLNGVGLPVRFVQIRASRTNADQTSIQWLVADEINIDTYVIEAATETTSFATVGKLAANNSKAYTFLHNNAATTNFYRIKAVSKSGEISYSNIVHVAATKTATFKVYPNPVTNQQVSLSISDNKDNTYQLQITAADGKRVVSQIIGHKAGSTTYNVAIPAVQQGYYRLSLFANNQPMYTTTVFVP